MSLTSLYNAYLMKGQNPSEDILERIRNIKPRKITIDLIARESPHSVRMAREFGIQLKDLLIYEHYRHVVLLFINETNLDRLETRVKNYDYLKNNNMSLLRQAANRLEANKYGCYFLDERNFRLYKQSIIDKFNSLKRKYTRT